MKYLVLLCMLPLWTACTPWVIGEHSPDVLQALASEPTPSLSPTSAVAPLVVSAPDPGPAPVSVSVVLTPLALVQPPPSLVETAREVVPVLAQPVAFHEPARRLVSAPRPLSPLQMVHEGQQGARIGPGSPGYRQVGAMHFYQYAVGAVYDLYVSPSLATGLLFPPGAVIKVGLFLPKDDFDVDTKSTGEAAQAYDALTIHPKVDKGEYDAFVLMTNGDAYLFRLIVGKKGMLTVSFDLPLLEVQR